MTWSFCVKSHIDVYPHIFVMSIKTDTRKYLLTLGLPCYKWRPKMDFDRWSYNNRKFSITKPMTNYQPCDDWKFSITIRHIPIIRRWLNFFSYPKKHGRGRGGGGGLLFWGLKNFNCHSTYPHCWVTIEIFQSSKGVGHMLSFWEKLNSSLLSLLGNQRISIAIQWCGCVEWQPKCFGRPEGGTRDGNQNLWSPFNTPS